MPNPSADFPAAIHTAPDVSAFGSSKLGSTTPTHTDLEGKQEAELVATQTKVGYTTGANQTPTTGKVPVGGATAGTSAWVDVKNALPTIVTGYVLGESAGNLAWVSPSAGAGETNTGANVNTAGVGVYDSKTGVQLGFRGIDSPLATITPTLNAANKTVEVEVNQANLSHASIGGTTPISKGGTGQTAKTAAFNALSPNSTLGDVAYHDGTNNVRLAGNTTAAKKFLTQTGSGAVSAAPGWNSILAADVPTLTASKISDFQTTAQGYTLDTFAAPVGNINLNSNKIVSLADPISAQDAATKAYVDATSQGLDIKASVRAATTASIANLTSVSTTLDGLTLVQGDRILVKDTASADGVEALSAKRNGIYVVGLVTTGTAPWTRATDANTSAKVTSGMYAFVSEGTVNGSNGYIITTPDPITLDTTLLTLTQFSGAGQIISGAGLTKTGNTLNVGAGTGITVNADDVQISASYAGQASITTLGTIATGTWQGTVLGAGYGGTGVTCPRYFSPVSELDSGVL